MSNYDQYLKKKNEYKDKSGDHHSHHSHHSHHHERVTIIKPIPTGYNNIGSVSLSAGSNNIGNVTITGSLIAPTGTIGNMNIGFADTPAIDAFGRLRVSNPYALFSIKQVEDSHPLLWVTATGTTGGVGGNASITYNQNLSCSNLNISNISDMSIRQSRVSLNYQPGKSHLIFVTFCMGTNLGSIKRVGYFDFNDGIFLEQAYEAGVTGTNIVLRSSTSGSPTGTVIPQSLWNVDKFDGSGGVNNPSGIKLDISKVQILTIDMEWLGVGRVRVGFVINGIIYYAHYFLDANIGNMVYMRNPNLPIRYEIIGKADHSDTLMSICSAVSSEGGCQYTGVTKTIYTPTALNIKNPGTYPIIAIQLQPGYNMSTIQVKNVSIVSDATSAIYFWKLSLNSEVNGPLTYTVPQNSSIQYAFNTNSSTGSTGGTDIIGDFAFQNNQQTSTPTLSSGSYTISNVLLGYQISTTGYTISDKVVLSIVNMNTISSGGNFYASISYEEDY